MHHRTTSTTATPIDHTALTAALHRHGFQSLDRPLVDGKCLPLQPCGWIRRDGDIVSYGDADRSYTAGGGR